MPLDSGNILMHKTWALLLAISLSLASAPLHADDLLVQADNLMKSKKPEAAYQLLAAQENNRAGDPDFDYLLGVAALDSGRRNEAVFAFERVLAINPGHNQARAELARAHFELGERVAAQVEFKAVLKTTPPTEVQKTIQGYLDTIDRQIEAEKTQVGGFMEVAAGWDGNVNAATGERNTAIAGLPVTLPNSLVRQEDFFVNLGGGIRARHQLGTEWTLLGAAGFNARLNKSTGQADFDNYTLDGNMGIAHTAGDTTYTLAYQHQTYYVDYHRYRSANGFTGQVQHNLDFNTQITVYGQISELVYPGLATKDGTRNTVGAALARALGDKRNTVFYIGAYMGDEGASVTRGDLQHGFAGVRAGGQMNLANQWTGFAYASVEQREYLALDPIFGVKREDVQFDITVGANYTASKEWTLRPQLQFTRSDSNIIINDFDRLQVSVAARRAF